MGFTPAATPLGSQYLYSLLRNYQPSPASLEENIKACRQFMDNGEAGRALRGALKNLNRTESADLAAFLLGPPLTNPPWPGIFYLLSAAALACPFGLIISGWFILPSIGFWILNVVVHCRYGRHIARHASDLRSLAVLLTWVPRLISALQNVHLPELQTLGTLAEVAADLRKKVQQHLPNVDCSALKASTFHAYCFGLLKAHDRAFEARPISHDQRVG